MKKLVSMLLVMACAFSMTACGGSESANKESENEGPVTAKVIDVDLTSEQYAFGVDKTQPELLEEANALINEIKEDGTLSELSVKYYGKDSTKALE